MMVIPMFYERQLVHHISKYGREGLKFDAEAQNAQRPV